MTLRQQIDKWRSEAVRLDALGERYWEGEGSTHPTEWIIATELRKRADEAEEAIRNDNARYRAALTRIAKWFGEFPGTGKYHADGVPMSFSYCYGSNGERDFMRGIAQDALDGKQ